MLKLLKQLSKRVSVHLIEKLRYFVSPKTLLRFRVRVRVRVRVGVRVRLRERAGVSEYTFSIKRVFVFSIKCSRSFKKLLSHRWYLTEETVAFCFLVTILWCRIKTKNQWHCDSFPLQFRINFVVGFSYSREQLMSRHSCSILLGQKSDFF